MDRQYSYMILVIMPCLSGVEVDFQTPDFGKSFNFPPIYPFKISTYYANELG